jgi:hypothetical protein
LLSSFVRVCSNRCAPQRVRCICCFFTMRLLITWLTVDSTNESAKNSGVPWMNDWGHLRQNRSQNQAFEGDCLNHLSRYSDRPALQAGVCPRPKHDGRRPRTPGLFDALTNLLTNRINRSCCRPCHFLPRYSGRGRKGGENSF